MAASFGIGGHDLRSLRADDVYSNVAVVNQDTYLFHGTVEDNVRFGKPDATAEQIEAAARAANAHEFVMRLPDGYATVIGERGIKLSGGQRQRVAIARALLRDAPILILDEALSAVDAENEAVIQSALDQLMQGRTTLIFAHRLSSVIAADRILVLEQGSIVEVGDHASLVRARGAYFRLMGAQAEEGAQSDAALAVSADGSATLRQIPLEDVQDDDARAHGEPTDAILRAEGLRWTGVFRELLRHVVPWKAKFSVVLMLGIVRVVALIGVGVAGALAVAAVKRGEPFTPYLVVLAIVAPLSGVLHWLESWFAHDMAFRMLAEMRIALFNKLDRLAPAYLVRRRTGDLVGMATHDVELVEYFFAHTVAPSLVAVLVPAAVVGTLAWFGWPMALALAPFLAVVAISPFLARRRIDVLGSRAREAFGDMNAHAVDTIQGLSEILAFQRTKARAAEFVARIERHTTLRLPFYADLTRQTAILEAVTGLGGLVVVATGMHLVATDALRARDPAHADPARDVGVSARVRDRPHRPTTRRHAGFDAPALRGPQRGRGGDGRTRGGRGVAFGGNRDRGPRRRLLVSRQPSPRARRGDLHRTRGQDAGAGRPVGGRQDHRRAPLDAVLGPGFGRHPVRWPRPARVPARRTARSSRAGHPGYLPVQRDTAGEHPHRKAGGDHGRTRQGGAPGLSGLVRGSPPGRPGDARRRAGGTAVRGTAPARRDRTGVP